jgi:hypothetical protein
MKYKPGDKVKLKRESREEMCSQYLEDLDSLDPPGVMTIRKIQTSSKDEGKTIYRMKEFEQGKITDWLCVESSLEFFAPPVPINNRFEILDI